MWVSGSDLPEIWNELRAFLKINWAEPRLPLVFVAMNVKHRHWLVESVLKSFAECRAAQHRAHGLAGFVILVRHLMESVCEQQDTSTRKCRRPARQERYALERMRMRS